MRIEADGRDRDYDLAATFRRVLAGDLLATRRTVAARELRPGEVTPDTGAAMDYLARAAQGHRSRLPAILIDGRGPTPLLFRELVAGLQVIAPDTRVGLLMVPVDPDLPEPPYFSPQLTPPTFGQASEPIDLADAFIRPGPRPVCG